MSRYINKRSLIVLATTLVCGGFLWLIGFGFGREAALARFLGLHIMDSDVYSGTWLAFVILCVVGVGVPYLIVRYILKEKVSDYGMSFGKAGEGAKWIILLGPLYLLLPLASAYLGTDSYYTYLKNPVFIKPVNIAIHSVSYLAFTLGYEYLFRGFGLFGLSRAMGDTRTAKGIALAVSAVLSSAFLLGLPWVFAVSALASAIPGGLLNFRLRSFVYFAFFHWNVGIWSDLWEVIKLNITGSMW